MTKLLIKSKRKKFIREVLDFRVEYIINDICEIEQNGNNTAYDFTRILIVKPQMNVKT